MHNVLVVRRRREHEESTKRARREDRNDTSILKELRLQSGLVLRVVKVGHLFFHNVCDSTRDLAVRQESWQEVSRGQNKEGPDASMVGQFEGIDWVQLRRK